MIKYILTQNSREPMIFNVLDCAELYKVIYGGIIYTLVDGEVKIK